MSNLLDIVQDATKESWEETRTLANRMVEGCEAINLAIRDNDTVHLKDYFEMGYTPNLLPAHAFNAVEQAQLSEKVTGTNQVLVHIVDVNDPLKVLLTLKSEDLVY